MDQRAVQWDEDKAAENRRKHGVDFVEAIDVLRDPQAATIEDRQHSVPGQRRVTVIGMSRRGRLLRVTVALRGRTIRIISARRASARERHDYEEG
jgi:uncharacterized DUF497 family protein